MTVRIVLTPEEFWLAVEVSKRRFMEAAGLHLNHATTYQRTYLERLEQEVIGACGECAVDQLIGRPWGSVNTFHGTPDVGPCEVRATKYPSGRLILRPWEVEAKPELNERPFVLVTGSAPDLTIVGWLIGREIQQRGWWDDPKDLGKPCWMAPQDRLHAAEQLPQFLAWREGRRVSA